MLKGTTGGYIFYNKIFMGSETNALVVRTNKLAGNKAFTLIELLVVLVILSILALLSYIGVAKMVVESRNSTRLTNLKTIESGLKIQFTQGGAYAVPDNYATITASGTEIRKQGVFGNTGIGTIKASTNASTDPLTKEYYTYVTDRYLQQYQLVGNMEGENVAYITPSSYPLPPKIGGKQDSTFSSSPILGDYRGNFVANASTLTGYTMKSLGADLGIIYSGSTEMHKSYTGSFDVRREPEVSGNSYRIVFAEGDEITSSSGSELFSNIYNRDKLLLQNKDLAKLDDSLVLYFDMETTTMSGSLKVLKDLSKYGNNGELLGGIDIGNEIGENGKATYFDGLNDYINVLNSEILNTTNDNISVYSKILLNNISVNGIIGKYGSYGATEGKGYVIVYNTVERFYFGGRLGNPLPGKFIYINNSDQEIKTGRFYDLFGTFNNGKMSFFSSAYDIGYKDYVSNNGINNPNLPITIGRVGGYYLKGTIDEVRIYNRALSEKEIKAVYGSTIK